VTLPVSVVVPVYNNRTTVADAIRSVFGQTILPAEVIAVDDGSVDGSADVIRGEFGDRVILIQQPNGGPSYARNTGIEAAHEPFVAFLDADDVWHPSKLEVQFGVLERYDDVGVVAADWVRRPEEWPPLPVTWPTEPISYQDILILNRFQTSTVLARTALVKAVGGFDSAVDGAEDWDLWIRLAAVTRVLKVAWPLVVYRDVETGYSKDVWRVYVTMHKLLDKQRDTGRLSRAAFEEIETWHHLRFAVGLLLLKDARRAGRALLGALSPRLRPYLWKATTHYLLPFLRARYVRRRAQEAPGRRART